MVAPELLSVSSRNGFSFVCPSLVAMLQPHIQIGLQLVD
jgi:hypothetical protein